MTNSLIAVNSTGQLTLNGAPYSPRGSNFPMDSQIMGAWPLNAFGSYAGFGGPPFATYLSWNCNVVRLTINVAAWLNLGQGVLVGTQNSPAWLHANATATTTAGTTLTVAAATSQMTGKILTDLTGGSVPSNTTVTYVNATTLTTSNPVTVNSGDVLNLTVAGDPNGVYKTQVWNIIDECFAAGIGVIIDAHWCAPQFTFGGITNWQGAFNQPIGPDYNSCYPFWCAGTNAGPVDAFGAPTTGFVQAAINRYGPSGIGLLMFEIFNEPFFDVQPEVFKKNDNATVTTYDVVMKNGGFCSIWYNQGGTGRGGVGIPYVYIGGTNAITGGSGYTNGTYTNVPVTTTGAGSGATATVTVAGGAVTAITFPQPQGNSVGYLAGDTISVAAANIGGTGSGFTTTISFVGGAFYLNSPFQVLGYQQAVNGIRSLGAKNVIICNPPTYTSRQSVVPLIFPTDSLTPPQLAAGWHCYEYSTSGYPQVGLSETGSGTAAAFNYAQANINGTSGVGYPIPVIATEYAPTNGAGAGSTDTGFLNRMIAFFKSNPVGSCGETTWQWGTPVAFGGVSTYNQQEIILGAAVTFTGSITGNVLTVTGTPTGGSLAVGMVFSNSILSNSTGGGTPDRCTILSFGTGSGGAGTYNVSTVANIGTTTLYAQAWLPIVGQGLDHYNGNLSYPFFIATTYSPPGGMPRGRLYGVQTSRGIKTYPSKQQAQQAQKRLDARRAKAN